MFGDALRPPAGTPAAWVDEEVRPIPKNIYGTTKTAAEDLCRLFYRKHRLNCIILRTSRFFPEEDDDGLKRESYDDSNVKANEFLFRRVELEDVVSAHLLAARRAAELGFGRYIISATTPFLPEDLLELNTNAPDVVQKRVPDYLDIYQQLGWKMFDKIDRVYVNEAARRDLGWEPKYDFAHVLDCVRAGGYPGSPISKLVGSKGYHEQLFEDGPYPVQ
jgi:nucleoside-diphosphate-sugar epimerase